MEEETKEDDIADMGTTSQILSIIQEQNKAITAIAGTVSTLRSEIAGMHQQAVKELAQGLPREQLENALKGDVDDDAIVNKLAQVLKDTQKTSQQPDAPPMYNLFTSKQLNSKRQ